MASGYHMGYQSSRQVRRKQLKSQGVAHDMTFEEASIKVVGLSQG